MTTIRIVYFNREGSEIVRRVGIFKDPDILIERFLKLKKELPKARFFLVNASKAEGPPEDHVIPFGKKWCPYCNLSRRFIYQEELNVIRCSICHISDRDYYVKKFNLEISE